jgi:hypothetical protein
MNIFNGQKSQVTLIIAIALFILIIAAFIIYVANYYKNKNPIEPLVFERVSIENYINNCVKKTAEDGLKLLGKEGFVVDNSLIPSMEEMQNQLSSYVDKNLNICLKNFEDFENQGWDVGKNSLGTKTQINEKDVSFDVNYQLTISDKTNIINFERFATKLNIRLKYIYELVSKIVDFKSKYNKEVDLTTLRDYDFEVTVFTNKDSFVYVIDDHKSLIMNEPYRFILTIKEQ